MRVRCFFALALRLVFRFRFSAAFCAGEPKNLICLAESLRFFFATFFLFPPTLRPGFAISVVIVCHAIVSHRWSADAAT